MALQITSTSFGHEQPIPAKYTCQGEDLSPPLRWDGVPPEAKSLALIVLDPDAPDPAAPKMTFTHWVLYDLPVDSRGLDEGVQANALPPGTLQGVTDFQRVGYGGPCPPIGRHRYYFKLYALDTKLPDLAQPTRTQLEEAMRGHVLAQAELMGTYQKH
ncbi:MAG: YbhB/YbcL family Raf kinase inhibitor-like protein [Myxococcales bacterium]|jgi:Raf kinase inhibitor-like YbhB/YbcL family protein|nr:YbhB/YbcL family Raf kinase inhibitor-like protein [Myxococcales bacterium]